MRVRVRARLRARAGLRSRVRVRMRVRVRARMRVAYVEALVSACAVLSPVPLSYGLAGTNKAKIRKGLLG